MKPEAALTKRIQESFSIYNLYKIKYWMLLLQLVGHVNTLIYIAV